MWKLLLVTLLCGIAQAQTVLNPLPCSQEASLESLNSNVSTTVDFQNQTSQTVRIYWLNFSGMRVLYDALSAGTDYVQGTFVTHPWVVTDLSDTCIAIFEPVSGAGVARIGSGGGVSGAKLQISSSALQFSGYQGGDSPAAQILAVTATPSGSAVFSVQIDGGSAGSAAPAFLSVQPLSGTTPANLTVRAATGSLAAGSYSGRIRVSNPNDASQAPLDVTVTFTVTAAEPALDVSPNLVRVEAGVQAATPQVQLLVFRNSGGGGPLNYTVTATGHSPWISLSPASGQILPNAPASVAVVLNPVGLTAGSYLDSLQVSTTAGSVSVPVALFVAPTGSVLDLNLTGLRFSGRQGEGVPSLDPVQILNSGDAGTVVHWTAALLSGADWLSLGTTSGSSSPGSPSLLRLTPTSAVTTFPAGTRYALVEISDPQAQKSPQFVAAVLDLAPAASPPMPTLVPAGLFFTGASGGTQPGAQLVAVNVSSSAPITFQTSAITSDGAKWLAVSSSTTTTSTANPAQLSVSVNPAILTPGIYTGTVQVVIGAVLRALNVTLVVTPRAASNQPQAAIAMGCTPARIAITQIGLTNNFSVPASFPAALIAQLNNDCSAPILNGSVVASFSNGDPPLRLSGGTLGVYSATWQPRSASAQTAITVRATAGALLPATSQLLGGVSETSNRAPVLVEAGTLNNLNPMVGAALAPGTVAQVYGSGFASSTASAATVPLPGILNGTQILIGGLAAPIYFLSGTQMVVQIPTELASDRQNSVIAIVNGALSLPDTLSVAPAVPGIAAFPDGTIIAQHSDFTLVDATNPAHPNELLVMYLVGMGSTSSMVQSGTAAPSDPPATVTVQPTVLVDDQAAEILFAGLTPGGVGLYQINFRVPATARAGNLNVVMTQGSAAANVVTLPVAP